MRYAATLVVGLILFGVVSTVVFAQSIFDTSFESQQKILSAIKVPDLGKIKIILESPSAQGHVGYPGEPGYPGSSSFTGTYTMTTPGQGGTGSPMLTDTLSMSFPCTSSNTNENKLGCKADDELWLMFDSDLEDFINRSHGSFTDTVIFTDTEVFTDARPYARAIDPSELGGPIQITSIQSKGKIKTDKKTFSKYRGRLLVKYTGIILSGPNQGKEVKGTLKVKMKKGVPLL